MGSSANMPSVTLASFQDTLERSGLVPTTRDLPTPSANSTVQEYAARLVEEGALTRFQADKLLTGQWQGLILGAYRILSPLGRGGVGVVYLARELNLDGPPGIARPLLAIKVLPPTKSAREPRTRARFLREMEIGQIVPSHPYLTQMFDCGELSGVLYIAMEYVPGHTVKAEVSNSGAMAVGHAARVFSQVAEGMATAHAAGLVHRDLKPANIMIRPDGSAKLLDFGFAIRAGERWEADPMVIGGEGYVLGTMDYIAPEQTTDAADVSPATDQYSLGCSLYFALAGCPPFPGGTTIQKIRWHRKETPPPLRSLRPDLPADLVRIIDRLMAKKPENRFPSAFHVSEILRYWASEPAPLHAMAEVLPDENVNEELEAHIHEIGSSSTLINAESSQSAIRLEVMKSKVPAIETIRQLERLPLWAWWSALGGVLVLAMIAGFVTGWMLR